MWLIRSYGLKFLGSCLFIFAVSHQSALGEYNFTKNHFLNEFCTKTNLELPRTNEQCSILIMELEDRYGADFVKQAKETVDAYVRDGTLQDNTETYWDVFYTELEDLITIYVEPFLTEAGLTEIPVDMHGWRRVKSFIEPKLENVLNDVDKNEIKSVLDSELSSESEYRNAFIEISKLYFSLIPSSKCQAILQLFGYRKLSDNVENVIEKIGGCYVQARKTAAFLDAIGLARRFMENAEQRVNYETGFSTKTIRCIIRKVFILESYYGLELEYLPRPELIQLYFSDINEFFDIYPKYRDSTKYEATRKSTVLPKSQSSTILMNAIYDEVGAAMEPSAEESGAKKKPEPEYLSNHYIKCRMMLLANKPDFVVDLILILKGKGKTSHAICMSWQELYEKLSTYIHEPENRLELPISNQERISAVRNSQLINDDVGLLSAIIEADVKTRQKANRV